MRFSSNCLEQNPTIPKTTAPAIDFFQRCPARSCMPPLSPRIEKNVPIQTGRSNMAQFHMPKGNTFQADKIIIEIYQSRIGGEHDNLCSPEKYNLVLNHAFFLCGQMYFMIFPGINTENKV